MTTRGLRGSPRRAAAVLALTLLTGCKSWQPVMDTPASWIARESPPEVRLTAATGAQVTIRSPIVVNDSILSASDSMAAGPFARPRAGVLASDVQRIEVPRFDALKTAGMAAGFLAVSISWARTAGKLGGGQEVPEPPLEKFAPGFRLIWRMIP